MYYVYILYSESSDRYYVGQTNDVERRLEEHNHGLKSNYTSKYRPWMLKGRFEVGESLGLARKIERYIKNQKSRKYIEGLLERGHINELKNRFGEG